VQLDQPLANGQPQPQATVPALDAPLGAAELVEDERLFLRGMPRPVSRTVTVTRSPASTTVRLTLPRAVNLTALVTRLSAIWRNRVRSPQTHGPAAGSVSSQSNPLSPAS